jgi:hypothetical protein
MPRKKQNQSPGLVLFAFTAAVFTSAFLLFAVQPLFTRMVLPRLGGSPGVWSIALVFFQTMLLAGYAYAHFLMQAKTRAIPIGVHLAVLVLAGLLLPLSIGQGWQNPPSDGAAFWLLGLFAVSIGPPFFALAANNPLLQAWFARTGHRDAHDPYFLYAASNIGSFLALVSYPLLVEPALTVRQQNLIWTGGFALLIVLIGWCAYIFWHSPRRAGKAPASPMAGDARAGSQRAPDAWRLSRWIFLSAIPSGLLVAVTAHISTDVGAAPLLWIIPLSLYLLTWVLVFQSRPLIPHRWVLYLQPAAIVILVALLQFPREALFFLALAGHLVAFFIIALAAHSELARDRPPAAHLTGFYLSLSAGGMIGGLFAGLIAPFVFSWVAEYPILIVLAALCRPLSKPGWDPPERLFWAGAIVLALAIVLPQTLFSWLPDDVTPAHITGAIVMLTIASLLLVREPLKFAFAIALALAMIRLYPSDEGRSRTVRSFFGVHKIFDTEDGRFRVLMHGTTIHGAQRLRDSDDNPVTGRPEPLTYYHSGSGMAQALAAMRKRKGAPLRVAVIGLGSGSLACHIQPRETWKFFEIDQTVVAFARDTPLFTFVSSCAPDVPIVLGDARLTLTREPDGFYDVIIVDAYSSDSIPIHLATREAMAIYRAKLAPRGIVVMHVSNQHLELSSVAAGIAAANGLKTWDYDGSNEEDRDDDYIFHSDVTVSAASEADIGDLAKSPNWTLLEPDAAQSTWTDDYSNIVGAILRRLRKSGEDEE